MKSKTELFLRRFFLSLEKFTGSGDYWEKRYAQGGTSGAGSYGKYQKYKSSIINNFLETHEVKSVIEFGCGDGNQLQDIHYLNYIGFDVSHTTIEHCQTKFQNDAGKQFFHVSAFKNQTADLAVSLDVIYHLVEDDVYMEYMSSLVASAQEYIIIFSSNTDKQKRFSRQHVKHRIFTMFFNEHPSWELIETIKTPSSVSDVSESNAHVADFYIFKKVK